jgi:hypothetical protein
MIRRAVRLGSLTRFRKSHGCAPRAVATLARSACRYDCHLSIWLQSNCLSSTLFSFKSHNCHSTRSWARKAIKLMEIFNNSGQLQSGTRCNRSHKDIDQEI